MRKKWVVLSLGLCLTVLVSYWGFKIFRKPPITQPTQHHLTDIYDSYYVPISILKFRNTGIPCISVEIEEKTISTLLDLGAQTPLTLVSECVEHITNKTAVDTVMTCGIDGIAHEEICYLIPRVSISPLCYTDVTIREETSQSWQKCGWNRDGNPLPAPEPGTIGWELFSQSNLFLDLANSTLAACDSLQTLQTRGYFTHTFIKAPLLTDRGFLEFEGTLLEQPIRFLLDTGSTWNVFNAPLEEGVSMESMIWEPENLLSVPSVKAGEHDLGPMDFLRIPIKLPIPIGAILGMEFFEEHLVFLDFINGFLYIAKTPERPQ